MVQDHQISNAKGQHTATIKLSEKFNGFRHCKAIAEDQCFGQRVDPVRTVVSKHAFAPHKGVATVMTGTVKQLAKIHVKVAQKCIESVNVA